ncbi:MAG TPA: extracellular solute-binding protein, partial [Chloroflexota bacterium]|nr:extracellular solute-binding protein [Chloroflexota bacterium]
LDTIARAGQVLDLTAAVDRAAWSAATTSEVTVGNRLWAVPLTKYLVGIAYDVATFQRAKLAGPPKTWSDLGTAFAALKKLDAIPEATAVKDGSLIYYSFMGLASTVLGPAGFAALLAGNRRLDDADLVAVLDQLVAWSDSYQKKPEASTYLEARTLFTTGQAASIVASTIDLAGYASVAPGRKLGFFPWPASDAAHDPLANRGLASLFAVNAATADPAAALGFARWLGSPPAAQIALDPLNLLPALDGVTPRGSGNALTTSLLAVPADVPVWHEQPLLAGLPQVWGQSGPNLITKKLSSADFAKSLQADVDKRRSGSG